MKETQTLYGGKPPVKTCRVPPVWWGVRDEQSAMARPTTVKTLPRIVSVAGGGETKGGNQREMERWHNPQSREGGEVPRQKRIAERKQIVVHHKEKYTKLTVLCHCVSSQITLVAPRLGAEEGVGRTKERK